MKHWWLLGAMALYGGAAVAQSAVPGMTPEQHKMMQKLQSMTPEQHKMMQKLQSMTPEQRQAFAASMQAQAAKSQACFSKIDQAQMQALQARGRAVSAKLDALCAAGKTAQAESYAMEEGREMMSDPTARQLAECSKGFAAQFDFSSQASAARGKAICER